MNKNYRTYGIVAGVVVLLAVGIFYVFGGSGGTLSGIGTSQAFDVKPTDMVHGSANAPVTIIEYASMTCPHCAAFQADVIPQLTKDYIDTGKAKLVFREYPLDGAARMASALARCFTGDQYFNFVDLLFKNQPTWWVKLFENNHQVTKEDVEASLAEMARIAGMSQDKATSCMNDANNLALVDANWMEGMSRYNVNSTPTFVINGTTHTGEISYDALKKVLDPLAAKS